MLYQVEGFVIRTNDYGEGHKIITLFTRELGKVSVMARGAKKLKSRFSAIAQLFTYAQFVFYKSGQMGTLNHGELLDSHHPIREDLHKAAYCAYLMEMIDRMLDDQEKAPLLFDQLKAALEAVEEGKDPQIVVHAMELKMLAHGGYAPQLEACVFCQSSIESNPFFSAPTGGTVCHRCKSRDAYASPLAENAWKLLRVLTRADLTRLGKTEVKPETKEQLKKALGAYMEAHVGTANWKAKKFLNQMDKYGL